MPVGSSMRVPKTSKQSNLKLDSGGALGLRAIWVEERNRVISKENLSRAAEMHWRR